MVVSSPSEPPLRAAEPRADVASRVGPEDVDELRIALATARAEAELRADGSSLEALRESVSRLRRRLESAEQATAEAEAGEMAARESAATHRREAAEAVAELRLHRGETEVRDQHVASLEDELAVARTELGRARDELSRRATAETADAERRGAIEEERRRHDRLATELRNVRAELAQARGELEARKRDAAALEDLRQSRWYRFAKWTWRVRAKFRRRPR